MKAIPQLARVTIHKGESLYLRCPYQSMVMKILDTVSSRIVCTGSIRQKAASSQFLQLPRPLRFLYAFLAQVPQNVLCRFKENRSRDRMIVFMADTSINNMNCSDKGKADTVHCTTT